MNHTVGRMLPGRVATAVRAGLFSLLLAASLRCLGQASPQTQSTLDDSKLDAKVTVSIETGSVSQLTAELSTQPGLSILAGPAIRFRKLEFFGSALSARQVLNALAETYGWRWYRQEPDTYVLDRRSVRRPTDLHAIPALMQKALPVDIRTFAALPDLMTKKPDDRTSDIATNNIRPASFQAINRLRSSLTGVFNKDNSIAVRELSSTQREDLLTWMLFASFGDSMELLHDDYAPHKMDIMHVSLQIHQLAIDIQTTPDVKPGFGFGAQFITQDGRPIR